MRALTIILVMLGLCTACGSSSSGKSLPISSEIVATELQLADGSLPVLPSLSTLPRPEARVASYVEEDLVKDGWEIELELPLSRVSMNEVSSTFVPDPAAPGLGAFAYAIYHFQIEGYDRNAGIQAKWTTPLTNNTYIAVSNWELGRWSWFRSTAQPALAIGNMDHYFDNAGNLYVAVVCGGPQQTELLELRIGSAPPVAVITTADVSGLTPFTATFDGSGSTDSDGSIVRYEWDINGNGIYELDTADSAQTEQTLTSAGFIDVGLRVTDNAGLTATSTIRVSVFDEWIHSWGGPGFDHLQDVVYDSSGSLYALGQTDSFGAGFRDALLLKYSIDGDLIWARTWGTADEENGQDLQLDSDGNLVTMISGGSSSTEMYLVTWNPDGEVLRSRRVHSPTGFFPYAMHLHQGRAYVSGLHFRDGINETAFLLAYDLDGALIWISEWDFGSGIFNSVDDVSVFSSLAVNSTRVYLSGTAGDRAALLICNSDGELNSAWRLSSGFATGTQLHVSGFNQAQVYIAGRMSFEDQPQKVSYAVEFKAEDPLTAVWKGVQEDVYLQDFVRLGSGNLLSCSGEFNFADGLLTSADPLAQQVRTVAVRGDVQQVNLRGLELLSSDIVLCCGESREAEGIFSEEISQEIVDVSLSWETFEPTALSASTPDDGDFMGTVTIPEGAVIDDDPEDNDQQSALILLRAIP